MKIRNRKGSAAPNRREKPNSARSCRGAQGRILTLTSSLALLISAASIALIIAVAEPEKGQEAEKSSSSPRSNSEGPSLHQRASPEDKGHPPRRRSREKPNTKTLQKPLPKETLLGAQETTAARKERREARAAKMQAEEKVKHGPRTREELIEYLREYEENKKNHELEDREDFRSWTPVDGSRWAPSPQELDSLAEALLDKRPRAPVGPTDAQKSYRLIVEGYSYNSVAAQLGIRPGDEIVQYWGEDLYNISDLGRLITEVEAAGIAWVPIVVQDRNGRREITVPAGRLGVVLNGG